MPEVKGGVVVGGWSYPGTDIIHVPHMAPSEHIPLSTPPPHPTPLTTTTKKKKKRSSIKELWHRLEKAWADFQWDFSRRHKGQKSFAFVCRSNRSDEPRAGGSACHRGPDLLWELISIIWGELYRLRVYSGLGEKDKGQRPTYCTKKSPRKANEHPFRSENANNKSKQNRNMLSCLTLHSQMFHYFSKSRKSCPVVTFSLCQAFHLIMSTLQSATAWLMLHFHEGNFNSTSSALNAHPIMRLSW